MLITSWLQLITKLHVIDEKWMVWMNFINDDVGDGDDGIDANDRNVSDDVRNAIYDTFNR